MTSLHRMGRPAPIEPRFNPNVEPATWPIKRLPASDNVLVLTNIGSFHDRFCRCRGCKPSLAGEER